MTDEQITEACRIALGWKHLGAVGVELSPDERHSPSEVNKKYPKQLWCLSGGNDWWQDPEGHSACGRCESLPEPLTDDAVAMALVKKLLLMITPHVDSWEAYCFNGKTSRSLNCSLNRAICECAAKL